MSRQQALSLLLLIIVALFYWVYQRYFLRGSSGSVLQQFTHDLTEDAEAGRLDTVIGREKEIERMLHILTRRGKNNPLLLGEPGVGKTAVVEGIANKIAAKEVPKSIQGKRILSLDLGALIGGTRYRGEFEQRMKRLTDEIKSQSRRIILFIDEVHMVEQAKGAEGAINVSDIIKPALARGDLQMIGATTWREYEEYIKPDDALNRRLQPVIIDEPSDEEALHILRGIKSLYEKHHGVTYEEEALVAAIHLSRAHIKERYLPDKAIDLIDEAGAKVAMDYGRHVRNAVGLLHAAGTHKQERRDSLKAEQELLSEEIDRLHQLETATNDGEALRHIRGQMEKLLESVIYLSQEEETHGEGKTPVVVAADIREIVAQWIGRPVTEVV